MTRINTNVSSLVAQNRLRVSNRDLQTSLTRLSTGLRINSGADDPAGLIASEALRSEITSLGKAISNTRRASQIIATADSALGQVSSLLNDVRGLIVEAANSGALSEEEIAANQLQIDSSLEAINRIAQTTTFQGQKLLDGSLDFISTSSSVPSIRDINIDQANLGATGQIDVEVVIQTAAGQANITAGTAAFTASAAANVAFGNGVEEITVTAAAAGSDFNDVQVQFVDDTSLGDVASAATYDAAQKVITVTYNSTAATATNRDFASVVTAIDGLTDFGAALSGGTGTVAFTTPTGTVSTLKTGGEVLADNLVFQLNGADGAETFNFGSGTSASQIASAVNLVSDSTGVSALAASATGLTFSSTAYGADAIINIDVISEGVNGTFSSSLSSIRDAGEDIVATVNGVEAGGNANTLTINTSTLDLNVTVDAGSSTNFSFSITGGGALFQLGPDVTSNQQARLGIASVSTGQIGGASGRLYELGSGQAKNLNSDITSAAKIIDEVINKVTSLRGRLGAFQSTTLDSNLVSLNETQANLQEAESSIRDADFAQESASLTRAQILVQSGTNVLSLANQNPQNVLSLLR
ncbi:MAG: flagellin [Pirellulales bacterium]|nr:flagellin [Pirellulales bacterium]